MTETEFRTTHSEVIEYYQYIEMRLKGICAALLEDEGRSWFEKLHDYDADPMGKLLPALRKLQTEKHIEFLSQEDFEALETVRAARIFWVHQCFSGSPHVTFKNHNVRHSEYAIKICSDLRDAVDWDEKLTEITRLLLRADKT